MKAHDGTTAPLGKATRFTTSLESSKPKYLRMGEPSENKAKGNPSAADAKKARAKKDGRRLVRNKGRR